VTRAGYATRALVAGLLALSLVLTFAGSAGAAASARLASSPLPRASAVVPGEPPSAAHPWGTVVLYGGDWDRARDEDVLVAVEWDLSSERVVRRTAIDRRLTSSVAAARDGAVTYLFVEGSGSPNVLYTLDARERVTARLELTAGRAPAIAVDGRWVVVAAQETRDPVLPRGRESGWAPSVVYHARAIDRATGRIAGARVFRGDVLLSPPARPSTQALALAGGRAVVSLPMLDRARLVLADLPSLRTVRSMDLAAPGDPTATALIGSFRGGVLATGPARWLALDAELRVERTWTGADLTPFAVMPGARRLLVDGRAPAGFPAVGAGLPEVDAMTWAWGRGVAVGKDATGAERVAVIR
jgi:hypothetical protein